MDNNKTKIIIAWILQVILAIAFAGFGFLKFTGPEAAQFFGFPTWSWIAIGIVEIGGGITMFFPKYAKYAALGLSGLMLGAIGTHIVAGFISTMFIPVILLVLLVIVFFLRGGLSRNQTAEAL